MSVENTRDQRAFHAACRDGDLATAKRLVSLGAVDVHAKHACGFRLAAKGEHNDIVEWLVNDCGVDVRVKRDAVLRDCIQHYRLTICVVVVQRYMELGVCLAPFFHDVGTVFLTSCVCLTGRFPAAMEFFVSSSLQDRVYCSTRDNWFHGYGDLAFAQRLFVATNNPTPFPFAPTIMAFTTFARSPKPHKSRRYVWWLHALAGKSRTADIRCAIFVDRKLYTPLLPVFGLVLQPDRAVHGVAIAVRLAACFRCFRLAQVRGWSSDKLVAESRRSRMKFAES